MFDRSKLSDVYKYVVEGNNAKKVYDVLRVSYVGKYRELPPSQSDCGYSIEYRYEDGVLHIEEHTIEGRAGYVEELLCFLIPYDCFYFLRERSDDGVPMFYDVCDDEGKYFVRPPKTQWEISNEIERMKEL